MKPKILIGTPHAGDITPEYLLRTFSMARDLTQYDLNLRVQDTSLIHVARNALFFFAKEHGCDYLLFIDSDMIWPVESLQQMIELDKDVVTGVYVQRYWPHRPTIYNLHEKYVLIHIDDFPADEPFRIEACGCGYMLIRRNVFEAFTDDVMKEMGQPFNLAMLPWEIKKGSLLGEDVSFGYRLKRIGLELWADPRIKLGHYGNYPYYIHHWQEVRKHLKDKEVANYAELMKREEPAENHLGNVSPVGGAVA